MSIVHDNNLIRPGDGAQAVSDDEHGFIANQAGNRPLNQFFILRVQGGGRLYRDNDFDTI